MTYSRDEVENAQYVAFCGRIVRKLGERVGAGDLEHLQFFDILDELVAEAMAVAIAGLLDQGYSLADIGKALGISRQAVHQRVRHRRGGHRSTS
jgi:hypothetical protein